MSARWSILLILGAALMIGCGGGGGGSGGSSPPVDTPTAANTGTPSPTQTGALPTPTSTPSPGTGNVQPIAINLGPLGNYPNGLFTSITLCVPGTSQCQTINDIVVDTGSYGLRVLGSAVSLPLPNQTDQSGDPMAECGLFVDTYTWGPVVAADFAIAGETAHGLPLQIIAPAGFPSAPTSCADRGVTPADTLQTLGANGILGIGLFVQDCGVNCAYPGPSNPNLYYSCPASGCTPTTEDVASQVQNPVASFATDNNGVVIELPAVGASGAATLSGSLIFGIGTESNNSLGTAQIYTATTLGNITTIYGGNSYSAFLDSGSNALFFLSSALTGIAECGSQENDFYCPSSTLNLTAQTVGQNGTSSTIAFSIANAEALFRTGNAAFNNLGGTFSEDFDWGVPFFLGRNVFVAIDGQETPAGIGPYWAF